MTVRKLSLEKGSTWKGALGTAAFFSIGVGVGFLALKQKHEEELDQLVHDTVKASLDYAAAHYEEVLRRYKEEAAAGVQPTSKTPYYEEFLEFQRKLDRAGQYEPSEEEWSVIEEDIHQQQKEHESMMERLEEQRIQIDSALDRVKLKILAEKATELANKAASPVPEELDIEDESVY